MKWKHEQKRDFNIFLKDKRRMENFQQGKENEAGVEQKTGEG